MRSYSAPYQARVSRAAQRRIDAMVRTTNQPVAMVLRALIEAGLDAVEMEEPESIFRERQLARMDSMELILRDLYRRIGAVLQEHPEDTSAQLAELDQTARDRAERRRLEGLKPRRLVEVERQRG